MAEEPQKSFLKKRGAIQKIEQYDWKSGDGREYGTTIKPENEVLRQPGSGRT